jgi:hypothetical protein
MSRGLAPFLYQEVSPASRASPGEIPEDGIDLLLPKAHSRHPPEVIAAAPGALGALSFFNTLFGYRSDDLL